MRESLVVTEFILLVLVNFLIGARIGSRGLATFTNLENMPGNIGIVLLGTIATYLLLYLQKRHGFVAEPEHIGATFICAVIGFMVGRAMRGQEKHYEHEYEIRQFHDDAAEGRHKKVLQHIERGIDVNARNPSGGTALMIAAKRGHLRVVQSLLQSGADPNVALHKVTYRALHAAAEGGHDHIVVELLEHGAAINAATQIGETALISAAYHGKTSTVELLLSRGADPDKTDRRGNRASDWAKNRGHPTTARVLEAAQDKNRIAHGLRPKPQ